MGHPPAVVDQYGGLARRYFETTDFIRAERPVGGCVSHVTFDTPFASNRYEVVGPRS